MMTKRQRAANGPSQSLHSVLRRRAKELRGEYNEQFVAVLDRAADALEAVERLATDDERAVIEAAGINRRLRNVLAEVHNALGAPQKWKGWQEQIVEKIRGVLSATKRFGDGLRLLTVEIGKDEPRSAVEAKVVAVLDEFYAATGDVETADRGNGTAASSAAVEQAPTAPDGLPG